MKLVILFFISLSFLSPLNAQDEIYENTWYLRLANIEGETIFLPQSSEFDNIIFQFSDNDTSSSLTINACRTGELQTTFIENNLDFSLISALSLTGDSCVEEPGASFEDTVFDFFNVDTEAVFNIETYYLIPEEGDVYLELMITSENNDILLLREFPVFLSNNTIAETATKIFPNPTSSTIHIQTQNQQKLKYNLYNNFGKTIISEMELNNPIINVVNLPRGIYFLQIDFENGQQQTHKFIKK